MWWTAQNGHEALVKQRSRTLTWTRHATCKEPNDSQHISKNGRPIFYGLFSLMPRLQDHLANSVTSMLSGAGKFFPKDSEARHVLYRYKAALIRLAFRGGERTTALGQAGQ